MELVKTCKECGTEKGDKEWFDDNYCSGKCANATVVVKEKTKPVSHKECRQCGAGKGTNKWEHRDFCSGKCKNNYATEGMTPEAVASAKVSKAVCLGCGAVQGTNKWPFDEYCSGKCYKSDGGYVKPAIADNLGYEEAADSQESIEMLEKRLDATVALLKKKHREVNRLRDARIAGMSKGAAIEPSTEYRDALAELDILKADVKQLEDVLIPEAHKAYGKVLQQAKNKAKNEFFERKQTFEDRIQDKWLEIEKVLLEYQQDIRAAKDKGVTLSGQQKSLLRNLKMSEYARKYMKSHTQRGTSQTRLHERDIHVERNED